MTRRAKQRNLSRPTPEAARPRVTIVERPDPAPDRWATAMQLLLDAGQSAEEDRTA